MKLRKLFAALLVGIMTVSALSLSAFAADGEVPAPGDFDPDGTEYIAQMYIQVGGSWVFRNPWSDKDYGTAIGYEYGDQLSNVEGGTATVNEGTFTDVKLEGNGTYTLTLENPDFNKADGTEATNFNLIGISTNIPASADPENGGSVKFTDVTIKVNDSSIYSYTYGTGVCDPDAIKAGTYMNILGVNIWNTETCTDANAVLGGEDVWPGEVSKVEITFTVEGFNYDKAEDENVETEATDETKAADETKADSSTSDTDKTDDSDSGLPTGAVIGIVAAVVVVIIIIIVAVSSSKKKKAD